MSGETYYVLGGIFADGSFSHLETGATEEMVGPFATEAQADQIAVAGIRRNVDICWHRLFVVRAADLEQRRVGMAAPHIAD